MEEVVLIVLEWLLTTVLTATLFDCYHPHFMEGSLKTQKVK